jgi:hypothetical protein
MSLFHAIGGIALGITLRGWANEPTLKNLLGRSFFLLWGSGFGCMPLIFAFQNDSANVPTILGAQIAVLLTAIAIPYFWLNRLRELASDENVVAVSIGGLFLLIGLVAGSFLVRDREWLPAVLFGGTFSLVGGGVFFHGLRSLLRSFSEDN